MPRHAAAAQLPPQAMDEEEEEKEELDLPHARVTRPSSPARMTLTGLFCLLVVVGVYLRLLVLPQALVMPEEEKSGVPTTLEQAVAKVALDKTVIVCAVSQAYLPFLSNWLISLAKHGRHKSVLIIAEDIPTLELVSSRWRDHVVLLSPAIAASDAAFTFGSQAFFNLTSRRPRHLLRILDLGFSVLYNDVDMVWLADPFPFFSGSHDVFLTDDMATPKPSGHSSRLPPPGKKGRTYICSCMLFLRPSPGAKLLLEEWIAEIKKQPWSPRAKVNDQPAFNWALMRTVGKVDVHVLPQHAFPTGGLFFKNETWRQETQGKHVVVHNNYITGLHKKVHRFQQHGLWYLDTPDASLSPLYKA